MLDDIIQLNGKEDGPTSVIFAGIHGNEKCGIDAIMKVLPNLKIARGRVFFIYGNPQAININRRFVGADLNRMFQNSKMLSKSDRGSYEYKRAQFLKKYLDKAEVLLDLHASSIVKSKPFIICEKNAKEIIKYLPIDAVVSGFDKIGPGGTDYYMNKIGKIGVCVECGYLTGSKSTKIAEKSIFAFLKSVGHIKNNIIPYQKKHYIKIYKRYLSKTDKFVLAKPYKNFEIVKRGQLIGTDDKEKIKAKKNSLILFAHNLKKMGEEAFILGENKEGLV